MNEAKQLKELAVVVGAGIATGIMFNIAITGNPLEIGGLLGGMIAGLLVYILS